MEPSPSGLCEKSVPRKKVFSLRTSERDYVSDNRYLGWCGNCDKEYAGPKSSRICFICSIGENNQNSVLTKD